MSAAHKKPVSKMKVKWTTLGMVVFFLLSMVMTCCFIWQYRMPKLETGKVYGASTELYQETPTHVRNKTYSMVFQSGTTFGPRPPLASLV